MKVGEKLKIAREAQWPKLSQYDVADFLKIKRPRYASWEMGRTKPPTSATKRLAEWWGVPHHWFWDETESAMPKGEPPNAQIVEPKTRSEQSMVSGRTVAIPVWRGALLGAEDECVFEIADEVEFRELPAFYVLDEPTKHVLLIPRGMSMAPRIFDRDRVLVRLDPDVGVGNLVVAEPPGDHKYYIKKFVRKGMSYELHSLNEEYEPITDLEGWTVKGGVVMIERSYEPGNPNLEWDQGRYLRA